MKRSVNFSAPAKFAALAAMRGSTTETWLAEPDAETIKRRNEDCAILRDHRLFALACALEVAVNSVSRKEPHQNVGWLIYCAYDSGWRSSGLHEFSGPNGEIRKAPSMMWVDAMRAIHEANKLRGES